MNRANGAKNEAGSAAAEVAAITDRVCAEHLDDEYAVLCRKAIAALARKRPSPLLRGEARTWAAGVIYTLGMVNFLMDAEHSRLYWQQRLLAIRSIGGLLRGGASVIDRDQVDFEKELRACVHDSGRRSFKVASLR